jgi:PadR family transcriptional regulator PadR
LVFGYRKGIQMIFTAGAALLDAIVLAVVNRDADGTYGYRITQDVRSIIEVSDSTLYPVLRRLMKEECLEVYDREFSGRNRRYYKITEKGRAQLNLYTEEWYSYSRRLNKVFTGESLIYESAGEGTDSDE